jgi:HD-like signal output (HDOD) protein
MDRSSECCEKALKALGELPPFSPVLNRLLATLGDEDVSYARVSDIIEKDTVIAGNVLKVVNSALYGRRDAITSVRRAVSLLGVTKLRNTVFSMSVSRMWNRVRTPPGWSMARFNIHSVATAILADLLAQRRMVSYAEGAFVAGLFHDLGKLLIAVGLRDHYERIQDEQKHRPPLEAEMEVLGFTHAELSAEVLARWNMPDPVRTAVLFHHAPEMDAADVQRGAYRLSLALACADACVKALAIGCAEDRTNGDAALEALARLDLEGPVQPLLDEFRTEFDAISAFFH